MREPVLQCLFHDMANPKQTRAALENGMGVSEVRTQCHMKFADAFNDSAVIPHYAVDVSLWVNVMIDVSAPPFQKHWTWVSQAMQEIKKKMTIVLRNFNASGSLVNDRDDMRRDLQFWDDFCHGDVTLFYIYMSWDHGRDVPAWNSTLLPEDCRMDIGCGGQPQQMAPQQVAPSPGGSGRHSKRGRDNNDADPLREFVDMQTHVFKSLASNPSSATTEASIPEVAYATRLEALSKSADILRNQLRAAVLDRDLLAADGGEVAPGGVDDAAVFDYEGHVRSLKKQLVAVVKTMSQVTV
jgi:hypothetical protein